MVTASHQQGLKDDTRETYQEVPGALFIGEQQGLCQKLSNSRQSLSLVTAVSLQPWFFKGCTDIWLQTGIQQNSRQKFNIQLQLNSFPQLNRKNKALVGIPENWVLSLLFCLKRKVTHAHMNNIKKSWCSHSLFCISEWLSKKGTVFFPHQVPFKMYLYILKIRGKAGLEHLFTHTYFLWIKFFDLVCCVGREDSWSQFSLAFPPNVSLTNARSDRLGYDHNARQERNSSLKPPSQLRMQ